MSANGAEKSRLVRVQFCGGPRASVSSTILRAADDTFTEEFISTIPVDFKIRTIQEKDDRIPTRLQLWDQVHNLFPRGVFSAMPLPPHVYVVCIPMDNLKKFNQARELIQELKEYSPGLKIVVTGTKYDIENPTVSRQQIEDLAQKHNASSAFVSAKTGAGCEELLLTLKNLMPQDKIEQKVEQSAPQRRGFFSFLKKTPEKSESGASLGATQNDSQLRKPPRR